MCGIFFCASTLQHRVDEGLLRRLREINAQRGPSSAIVHVQSFLTFIRRARCAIILFLLPEPFPISKSITMRRRQGFTDGVFLVRIEVERQLSCYSTTSKRRERAVLERGGMLFLVSTSFSMTAEKCLRYSMGWT